MPQAWLKLDLQADEQTEYRSVPPKCSSKVKSLAREEQR